VQLGGEGFYSNQAEEGDVLSRPVSTYSIVAIDKKGGEMGVAVQSHWFSVGSIVPWAESGVGVAATQAFVDASYGPLGLALMKGGKAPREALKSLLATDRSPRVRQVALLDHRGRVAVHTGDACIANAGHLSGRGFSVQANLMRNRRVWPAMASAFRRAKGNLASRFLATLDAAEEAGGDIRGRQSAAMLVVRIKPSGSSWRDELVDLRVEDDPEPLKELRRLVVLHQSYDHANRADELMTKGKLKEATEQYRLATENVSKNEELLFWEAVGLANHGKPEKAKKILDRVFKKNEDWREVLRRLPGPRLLNVDKETFRMLVS
jgi:uncharacterized Ntn-hydrolase superfamily protein